MSKKQKKCNIVLAQIFWLHVMVQQMRNMDCKDNNNDHIAVTAQSSTVRPPLLSPAATLDSTELTYCAVWPAVITANTHHHHHLHHHYVYVLYLSFSVNWHQYQQHAPSQYHHDSHAWPRKMTSQRHTSLLVLTRLHQVKNVLHYLH